ncbi:hypothetical protein H0E87_023861 [Populus deltoides]|uniref:QWRF motif-containing protein 2 n=1 Tax=Populus deltoides TaxID=3696 RepID=A0A8T2X6C2_POPDE|nr:hypothetical protein H0E87_023861 [Populus deltoides]
MVTAVSTPINPKTRSTARTTQNLNPARPPLLPSDPDNALAPRRPKSREVSSRYLSSASASASSTSTFNRCASPSISRRTAMMTPTPSAASAIKRSQSLERRRPATPRTNSLDSRIGNANCGGGGGGEITNAQRMLITSTRRLSVSFQGESFSFQVSKAKPTSSPSAVRKGTPERRKATTPIPTRGADQAENSRTMEQRRWPGRLRQQNSMTRSMDCSDDGKKLAGSGVNLNVVRALQNSMVGSSSSSNNNIIRSSIESRLSSDSSAIESAKPLDVNGSAVHSEHRLASDTESASSGTTSESSSGNTVGVGGQGERGARALIVPARFWKETNSRIRRQPEPGSPGSRNAGLKGPTPAKLIAPKKFGSDSPVSSPKGVVNSRGQLSPIRGGALRPASPSKFGTLSGASLSPMRGMSPSRVRNAVGGVVSSNLSNVSSTFSILSFAADIRRGRIGENRIVEVHLLRILHNRMLQWRFVNARADYALSAQRLNVEKSLYNARVTTSKLYESVRAKRTELQWLRHNLKLISILKGQVRYDCIIPIIHASTTFSYVAVLVLVNYANFTGALLKCF